MEALKYYLDTDYSLLTAYDKQTDFFVAFMEKSQAWEPCRFSFMQFRHDGNYREISREEAAAITNGHFPDALFMQYLDILNSNRE